MPYILLCNIIQTHTIIYVKHKVTEEDDMMEQEKEDEEYKKTMTAECSDWKEEKGQLPQALFTTCRKKEIVHVL